MFAKFDENGKIVSYCTVKKLEEIRPSPDGFEQIADFPEEDIWYLIKVDGIIKVDEERKAADKQKAENAALTAKYIPSESSSMKVFAKAYLSANPPKDSEEKLSLSGLFEEWTLGNYKVGDIRNYAGQTWECHQEHDNEVYPDITPSNAQTWATFWKPLHGKNVETARPWTKPVAGTTDMYHSGEYMVYTDEKIYRCKSDTVYSPEEYAQAWEVVA